MLIANKPQQKMVTLGIELATQNTSLVMLLELSKNNVLMVSHLYFHLEIIAVFEALLFILFIAT